MDQGNSRSADNRVAVPYDPADLAALGLPIGANEEEIRAAYRRLAIENHPDRGGTHAAMSSINEAFDRLMNPKPPPAPAAAPPPQWQPQRIVFEPLAPPETWASRNLFPAVRTAGIPILIALLVVVPAAAVYGLIYVIGKILF